MNMAGDDRYHDVAASFNEYLKDFFTPANNHTTYHFGYKPVLEIIGETKNFPEISVIDYGSGAGQFCAYLDQMGIKTAGIEISDAMLVTAKDNFPGLAKSFLNPQEVSADFENSFDICTMNFVTCEIPDEKGLNEILLNVSKLLKSQGKLIILTNNPETSPEGANYNIWSIGSVDTSKEGSPIKIAIHTDETSFDLMDYFWSERFMKNKLQTMGFEEVNSFCPKVENFKENIWKDEKIYSPTLIYTAIKP